MTNTQLYYLMLSVGFSVSILALIAIIVSPKTNSTQFYLSNTEHLSPTMVKIINLFGGDMLSLFPSKLQKKSIHNKEISDIFRASGNPWGVSEIEFFALRVAYGFVGMIVSLFFSIMYTDGIMPVIGLTAVVTFLAWNKPVSTYRKIAKDRETDFKKHFPEMLDYLTMIMSDGTYTFANAIEVALPYLKESSVKEEFTKVTDSINAGMSIEGALKSLGNRLPSESLQSFIRAVNNANTLNTPMDDLMRNRAKKSREDLLNEIELVIQALPTKTLLTVGPPAIISMLVIFMVPIVLALLSSI